MKKISKLNNEKKIKERLSELAFLISKHNKLYHKKDKPNKTK